MSYRRFSLSQSKAQLKDNEAVTTDIVGQAHVENYGTRIFEVADREDRAGNASLKTVKAYLAANQILETLSVFAGGLTEEVAEKQKYAKYRAAVIMKAVKAGEPIPLPENLAGNLEKSIGEMDPFENLNRAEPSHEVLPPAPCDDHKVPTQTPSIPSPSRTPSAAPRQPASLPVEPSTAVASSEYNL